MAALSRHHMILVEEASEDRHEAEEALEARGVVETGFFPSLVQWGPRTDSRRPPRTGHGDGPTANLINQEAERFVPRGDGLRRRSFRPAR